MYANYHTHTTRCLHARGEDREYVENAIKAGLKILGFADHTPMVYNTDYKSYFRMPLEDADGYFKSVTDLKKEYAGDIEIRVGLESEYYPESFEKYLDFIDQYPIEYMILGQHCLLREEDGIFSINPHGEEELLRKYYKNLLDGCKTGKYLYIAHPDVFNFTGDESVYDDATREFLSEIEKLNIPLEINRLGVAEHRSYPRLRFWDLCKEYKVRAVIGLDAHTTDVFADEASVNACADIALSRGIALEYELDIPEWKR